MRDYSGILPCTSPMSFCAYEALENRIHVRPGLFTKPYVYKDKIDWGFKGEGSSWQLYFHALQVVGYLSHEIQAISSTDTPQSKGERKRLIQKAMEIVLSWQESNGKNDSNNNGRGERPAWSDHAVAYRARNIIHLLSVAGTDISERKTLYSMLNQHAKWLSRPQNFSSGNHGVISSISLAEIGLYFPEFKESSNWVKTALQRMEQRVAEDVTENGVHMEHSPFYAVLFLRYILQAQNMIEKRGASFSPKTKSKIEAMKKAVKALARPDGTIPSIGDVGDENHLGALVEEFPEEGFLRGEDSFICDQGGVAVLRNKHLHLTFQSCFERPHHKHSDDLGFVLWAYGEEVFVGPGSYGYDDSEMRRYVLSTRAHNTLLANGLGYALKEENQGKARISALENISGVRGEHTMYGDRLIRTIFLHESKVQIFDKFRQRRDEPNIKSLQQVFIFSPSIQGVEETHDGVSFSGEKVRGSITQKKRVNTRIFRGEKDPLWGWVSPHPRQAVPVYGVCFSTLEGSFLTQIEVMRK